MDELDALLRTIMDSPDDDTLRLIYADRLEERGEDGDAERAEFIRYSISYPHASFSELVKANPFRLIGLKPANGNFESWSWAESDMMGCIVNDLSRRIDFRVERGFIFRTRAKFQQMLEYPEITYYHPIQPHAGMVTDKRPERMNNLFSWFSLTNPDAHCIPNRIMKAGGHHSQTQGSWKYFQSEEEAMIWLASALIAHARSDKRTALDLRKYRPYSRPIMR